MPSPLKSIEKKWIDNFKKSPLVDWDTDAFQSQWAYQLYYGRKDENYPRWPEIRAQAPSLAGVSFGRLRANQLRLWSARSDKSQIFFSSFRNIKRA